MIQEWPQPDDFKDLAIIESECVQDGIAHFYHSAMSSSYRQGKRPEVAAVRWNTQGVEIVIGYQGRRQSHYFPYLPIRIA